MEFHIHPQIIHNSQRTSKCTGLIETQKSTEKLEIIETDMRREE